MQNSLASGADRELHSSNPTVQFAASKSSSASSLNTSSEQSPQQSAHESHQTRGMLSPQASLGDLPPLEGASIGNTARTILAPLKKTPSSSSTSKSVESAVGKDKRTSLHGRCNSKL